MNKKIFLIVGLAVLSFCKDSESITSLVYTKEEKQARAYLTYLNSENKKLEEGKGSIEAFGELKGKLREIPTQIKKIYTSIEKYINNKKYKDLVKILEKQIAALGSTIKLLNQKLESVGVENKILTFELKIKDLQKSKDVLDKIYSESNNEKFKEGTKDIKSEIDEAFTNVQEVIRSINKVGYNSQIIESKSKKIKDAINKFNTDFINGKHVYSHKMEEFNQIINLDESEKKFKKLIEFFKKGARLETNKSDLYPDTKRDFIRDTWKKEIGKNHGDNFNFSRIFGSDPENFSTSNGLIYQDQKWFNFSGLEKNDINTYDVYNFLQYHKDSKWQNAKDCIDQLPKNLKDWFTQEKAAREEAERKKAEEASWTKNGKFLRDNWNKEIGKNHNQGIPFKLSDIFGAYTSFIKEGYICSAKHRLYYKGEDKKADDFDILTDLSIVSLGPHLTVESNLKDFKNYGFPDAFNLFVKKQIALRNTIPSIKINSCKSLKSDIDVKIFTYTIHKKQVGDLINKRSELLKEIAEINSISDLEEKIDIFRKEIESFNKIDAIKNICEEMIEE